MSVSGNFDHDQNVLLAEMILQGELEHIADQSDQQAFNEAYIRYYQAVLDSATANGCGESQAQTALAELGVVTR